MVSPFVTASVWNYCNQHCSYCLAKSQDWNFKGRFEVFRPEGCEGLNDFEIRERCGVNYYKKMCDDDALLNAADVMDVEYLAAWLATWRKDAVVHITGGEPLLRPDIESFVEKIATTHKVVLYTNGSLINRRKKLLDIPIFWHVTYHKEQITLARFTEIIAAIKDKPHRVSSVLRRSDRADLDGLKKNFKGYDFEPVLADRPKRVSGRPAAVDLKSPASKLFNLITPCGTVWPCNACSEPVGSIYTNTFDEKKAQVYDKMARRCLRRGLCFGFKTQIHIENLAKKWGFFDSRRKRLPRSTSG